VITNIGQLLVGSEFKLEQADLLAAEAHRLTCRSAAVVTGSVFVAVKGTIRDGHQYLDEALARGAMACVVQESERGKIAARPNYIWVENARLTYSSMSARWHEEPSKHLKVIGITGTNGKTTTAFLLNHVLSNLSSCGLIGTLGAAWGTRYEKTFNTTPDAFELQELLSHMVADGVHYACVEASSHGLDQDRLAHVDRPVAIFTNLTQDHLDYHADMADYFEAKKRLFECEPKPTLSFVNQDDPSGRVLLNDLKSKTISYSLNSDADYKAENIRLSLDGLAMNVASSGQTVALCVPITGLFNASNVLVAYACAVELGFDPERVSEVLKNFLGVPGRMERVETGRDFRVFVDYAHTPAGVESVLHSIREFVPQKLITVMGCGGDRDRGKRPLMGRIACKFSDKVILTSDNPRTEDPGAIIREIEAGCRDVPKADYRSIESREEAIAEAVKLARTGDVIMVLGKGHENYQIVGTRKYPFDDRDIVRKTLGIKPHVTA